ncbi:hypothetical protein CIHG_08808 [Coccidioides immitis H538.4]|uniref:Uncharacterized protein n=3 Tax=Coccidioides immitis TaxID=5501 RepID=A0A0J8TUN6_COCIT|nr:hypothetical protein CIRG_04704 [Coccidioides immitis RMSCC 2394]KMU77547.1 hypothetical protein CISG_01305 [Coccidioides immitis RMSCC 3703]KMU90952.1 hypothetical protein CIHG_08808 [Coccidioides immitis H538.4]
MVHRVKGRGIVVEGQTSLSPSRRLPRFPGDSWLEQTSPREKKSQVTRENSVPACVVIPGFPSQSGYMSIHASRFTTDGPTRVVADSSTSKRAEYGSSGISEHGALRLRLFLVTTKSSSREDGLLSLGTRDHYWTASATDVEPSHSGLRVLCMAHAHSAFLVELAVATPAFSAGFSLMNNIGVLIDLRGDTLHVTTWQNSPFRRLPAWSIRRVSNHPDIKGAFSDAIINSVDTDNVYLSCVPCSEVPNTLLSTPPPKAVDPLYRRHPRHRQCVGPLGPPINPLDTEVI